MSELDDQFQAAADKSKTLTERPDNETLLKLYSLFKQGSSGDVSGSKPSFMDPVGRAKYDAWSKLKGTPGDAAKQQYIDLINKLAG